MRDRFVVGDLSDSPPDNFHWSGVVGELRFRCEGYRFILRDVHPKVRVIGTVVRSGQQGYEEGLLIGMPDLESVMLPVRIRYGEDSIPTLEELN